MIKNHLDFSYEDLVDTICDELKEFKKANDINSLKTDIQLIKLVCNTVDSVTQLLKQNQKKIDEELGLVGKERFFSATLAAVFTGAFIAKKLNLHDIPIGPVYQKVASQMVVSRTDVEDRGFDVMSSLADYINSNIRDILVINGAADGRSGIQQAPIVKPMNNIKARIEPDGEMLFIPSSEFRTYCEKIKVPTADFLKGLKKEKILIYASESKNLTKGMDIKSPPARCLWINITGIEELSMTNLEFDVPKDIG